MHRKRKTWLYAIFAIVTIAVVVISLVLIPKNDEPNSANNDNTQNSNEVYATSFSVNVPNSIKIPVGSSINFLNGYINVSPSSVIDKLTIELTPSDLENGITFENNKLIANKIGNYSLKFKIPKSKSNYFSKTISINVCEVKDNIHINSINNTMVKGDVKQIYDMFLINDEITYSVKTDNNVSFVNNTITACNVGESELTFTFVDEYLEYVYDFKINIKDQPEYVILLKNVSNNTITLDTVENDVFHINYEIVDRNNEQAFQPLIVISNDEDLVAVEKIYDDVLIKIRALATGKTTIRISIASNPTIFVEINVIVQ